MDKRTQETPRPVLSREELFFLCGAILECAQLGGRQEAERLLGVSVDDPGALEYIHSPRGLQPRAVGRLIEKLGALSEHQPAEGWPMATPTGDQIDAADMKVGYVREILIAMVQLCGANAAATNLNVHVMGTLVAQLANRGIQLCHEYTETIHGQSPTACDVEKIGAPWTDEEEEEEEEEVAHHD
jgi:hypothetical protein